MPKFVGSMSRYPARAMFVWYAGLVLVGGTVLSLPVCRRAGVEPITWIDAVFTATSAACVTGLTVRSTGNDFSFVGQLAIAVLIQLGGLGIMTVTTFVTLRLGGAQSLRQHATISETLGVAASKQFDLRSMIGLILRSAIVIQFIGFVLLTIRFLFDYPFLQAIWFGAFHSISAFGNAGFGLLDDSLIAYQGDVLVNLTISALVIIGGIGFPVIVDVRRLWMDKSSRKWSKLTFHSKIVLSGTTALLIGGTIAILILEWDNSFGQLSFGTRFLAAFFQSMTTRTAGFNTVPIGDLTEATLFFMMVLMMIGASPCSAGGGFKVTTATILVLHSWFRLLGNKTVTLFRRSVHSDQIGRAVTTVLAFCVIGAMGVSLLLVIEERGLSHSQGKSPFLDAMFEAVSALGTVGLSTGYTGALSALGKATIIVLMFIGRVGPFSIFLALSRDLREPRLEYPREDVVLG